jgi:hypothetical protein
VSLLAKISAISGSDPVGEVLMDRGWHCHRHSTFLHLVHPITMLCVGHGNECRFGRINFGFERLDLSAKFGDLIFLGVIIAHHTTPRLLPWMSTPGWLSPYCSLRE